MNCKKYYFVGFFSILFLLGIFFRVYNFRDWLYFYPDQARDVMIVQDVLNGNAPLPLLGPIAASTSFKVGPMYYYFQIISAKIFGATPQAVAYPDLFFGILSIPLLYYFLKRYFSTNISLTLAGLYSVSFYAIKYSRFAWNSNPIPFFVILFLLSLLEFLNSNEKTKWFWVVALGIALGVGVQLHTVLLVLMPLTIAFVFLYLMRKNWKILYKLAIVVSFALVLNSGQILSEMRTNFHNTRDFFRVLDDRSPQERAGLAENFMLDVICHSQANVLYLLSAENKDSCNSFADFRYDKDAKKNTAKYAMVIVNFSLGLALLVTGYFFLFLYFRKEQDKSKKMFLGLMLLYGALSFLMLLPVIGTNGAVRYLLPIIFMPFLFLGFLIEYLSRKNFIFCKWLIALLVLSLIGANFFTIAFEAKQFEAKNRSNSKYVVLGEAELMADFIMGKTIPEKEAYILVNNTDFFWNYFKPLFYICGQKNFLLIREKSLENIPSGKTIYYMQGPGENAYVSEKNNRQIETYRNFGNVAIYKLEK